MPRVEYFSSGRRAGKRLILQHLRNEKENEMGRNGSDVLYSSSTLFAVMEFNNTISMSDHPERPGGISIKNTELTEVSKRWLDLQGYAVTRKEPEIKACPLCGSEDICRIIQTIVFEDGIKGDYIRYQCAECGVTTEGCLYDNDALNLWNSLGEK